VVVYNKEREVGGRVYT